MSRCVVRWSVRIAFAGVFVIVGYFLAVVSLRQELLVDRHSGARKSVCTLFPFSMSQECPTHSFQVLLGRSPGDNAEWIPVGSRHLAPWLDQEAITEGEVLVRAENHMLWSLAYTRVVRDEAERVSKEYCAALRNQGVDAAADYAERLYKQRAAEHFEIRPKE